MGDHSQVMSATERWLEEIVIGLQLCPFAQKAKSRLRYHVSEADNEVGLLEDLQSELNLLQTNDLVETSLLIHPFVLAEFDDYNQFLGKADELLEATGLEGEIQIASFHPQYQFAGTDEQSAENYSNRSPYPMLHLLRESSVSLAVDSHPDINSIPLQNLAQLNKLGYDYLRDRLTTLQKP